MDSISGPSDQIIKYGSILLGLSNIFWEGW